MRLKRVLLINSLLLFLSFLSCMRPPLFVRQENDTIIIDVATLGEYSSTVKRLRITNQSTGSVVWEIVASAGTPRLWKIELYLGSNPNRAPKAIRGSFTVISSPDAETFILESGVKYKVEAWGEGPRPAKEILTLMSVDQR